MPKSNCRRISNWTGETKHLRLSLRRLHIFIYLRWAFVVPYSKEHKCAIARMTTPRTFTFSFATKALLYLCLGLLQKANVFAAAAASRAFTASNELPPRRGSHISTGFVKPALLLSTSASSMTRNGVEQRRRRGGERNNMMSANASRRSDSGGGFGQQNERRGSYDLMNGMFDNECMQRHMVNTGCQEEQ